MVWINPVTAFGDPREVASESTHGQVGKSRGGFLSTGRLVWFSGLGPPGSPKNGRLSRDGTPSLPPVEKELHVIFEIFSWLTDTSGRAPFEARLATLSTDVADCTDRSRCCCWRRSLFPRRKSGLWARRSQTGEDVPYLMCNVQFIGCTHRGQAVGGACSRRSVGIARAKRWTRRRLHDA